MFHEEIVPDTVVICESLGSFQIFNIIDLVSDVLCELMCSLSIFN